MNPRVQRLRTSRTRGTGLPEDVVGLIGPIRRDPIKAIRNFIGYQASTEFGLRTQVYDSGNYTTAISYLMGELDDGYADGFRRFIWHLPVGQLVGPGGVLDDPPSCLWGVMPQVMKDDLENPTTGLQAWLTAHPGTELHVYIGHRISTDGITSRRMETASPEAEPPHVHSPTEQATINANLQGLLDLNPAGESRIHIHCDNSGPSDNRHFLQAFDRWLYRNKGANAWMEAFGAEIQDGGGNRKWCSTCYNVRAWALRQYFTAYHTSLTEVQMCGPYQELGFGWVGSTTFEAEPVYGNEYLLMANKGYTMISYQDNHDSHILTAYDNSTYPWK